MRPRWICCWPNPPMPARPGAASAHGCASTTAISRPGWPAIRCWRRADWDRSMPRPPTQMPRPATAWYGLARGLPGGGHGIRAVPPHRAAGGWPRGRPGDRGAARRRRRIAPAGRRALHARATRARNWRRATSWRARSGPRCRVSICPTCTWTSRTGARLAGPALSRRDGAVRRAWHRHRHAAHAGRALRALCLRRRPRGRGRRHRHRRPARRGRSRAHRPAWRQPAGQQFAAGMRGDGTGGGKRHRRIGRCSKRRSLGGVIAGAGATACSPSHAACPEMPGAPDTIRAALRRLMQQQAGIIRSDEGWPTRQGG